MQIALQKCMAADIPKVVEVSTLSNDSEQINGNIVTQKKNLVKCKGTDYSIHKNSSRKLQH